MVMTKHILIDDEVNKKIEELKTHKRETPNDVLRRILKLDKAERRSK